MYNNLLKIYKHPFTLVRFGRNFDGGYILPKELVNKDLISCGINDEISFENDYIKSAENCRIYAYDGTINKFPSSNKKNFIWEKFNIDSSDTKDSISLNTIFEKYNLKNVTMKMDIEGGEYKGFETITDENLSKIDCLIIEVHWLLKQKTDFEKLMLKLNKEMVLIHKHDNNNGGYFHYGTDVIPNVYELTFVNKRFISDKIENNIKLPIENLDFVNDVKLTNPKFID
jgi:hypothetical protein